MPTKMEIFLYIKEKTQLRPHLQYKKLLILLAFSFQVKATKQKQRSIKRKQK